MAPFPVAHVYFSGKLPTTESILTEAHALTGLDLLLAEDDPDNGCVLVHSEFKEPVICDFIENTVWVSTPNGKASYLKSNVIAALIHLGGTYEGKLSWFAGIKWSERKWWYFLPR